MGRWSLEAGGQRTGAVSGGRGGAAGADRRVLGTRGGERGAEQGGVLRAAELRAQKWLKMVDFVLCFFNCIFLKKQLCLLLVFMYVSAG